MAPRHSISNNASDSSDDDENDAPEAVSLTQSKKHIQKLESDVKTAALAQKLNKKRQNQERDKKLKERAEINKEKQVKGKGPAKKGQEANEGSDHDSEHEFGSDDLSGSEDELQARMRRAMQDAEDEDSDDIDEEAGEGDEWGGIGEENTSEASDEEPADDSQASDSENSDDDEDEFYDEEEQEAGGSEEEDNEEEVPPRKPQRAKSNPNHLPDELFSAAFAQPQDSSSSKPKRKASDRDQQSSNPPNKRRKPSTSKDIVIGKSTAIRLLPNSASKPPIPLTLPSKKINHFLDRSLALKGGKQRSKAWERRPANIGVLRQNGPATHFVRSR